MTQMPTSKDKKPSTRRNLTLGTAVTTLDRLVALSVEHNCPQTESATVRQALALFSNYIDARKKGYDIGLLHDGQLHERIKLIPDPAAPYIGTYFPKEPESKA